MLNDEEVQNAYVEGVMHDCHYEGDVKLTPDGLLAAEEFHEWRAAIERQAAARALEEAASSPIPREALTNGTRTWLRARAAEYRKAVQS